MRLCHAFCLRAYRSCIKYFLTLGSSHADEVLKGILSGADFSKFGPGTVTLWLHAWFDAIVAWTWFTIKCSTPPAMERVWKGVASELKPVRGINSSHVSRSNESA